MAKKAKKMVRAALKKNTGLLGRAARGMMGRRARLEAAISGTTKKKKKGM